MKGLKLWSLLTLMGVGMICEAVQTAPIRLTSVQVKLRGDIETIQLEFNQLPSVQDVLLADPTRLVIDLPKTQNATRLENVSLRGTQILKIRGHQTTKNLRLVFDLNQKPSTIRKQRMALKTKNIWQFECLFIHPTSDSSSPKALTLRARAPAPSITPIKSVRTHHRALRPAVIVIDAGHGGKDPGAIGPSGLYEKNVVLPIAKEVYRLLRQNPNIRPQLTRSTDRFVPLRSRLQITRKYSADLFISIHADAYRNLKAQGASVFALSQHGASSEAARWLAQKENYSELGGVDLEGKSQMLRSVLIDLSQTATIQESLKLGNILLNQLQPIAGLHLDQVEQAPFVVLKSPDIPSILVEIGFISNRVEEWRLKQPEYRRKVARTLADSIVSYLRRYPPANTVWAQ